MTNIDIIKRKLSEGARYFILVKKFRVYSNEKILKDEIIKGALERYLFLLCQSTIDLAEAVIVYYQLRTPATYGEIFDILMENNIIPNNLVLKMKKMTGFRNILVHAYGEIDNKIMLQVLQKNSNDIMTFIKSISKKVT
ncbi:MAG: DUF86 domain-containing protein [Patescibacteria group bacterium]